MSTPTTSDRVMPRVDGGVQDDAPWLNLYRNGTPHTVSADFSSPLTAFQETVQRYPNAPALYYFDGCVTWKQLDALAEALACHLLPNGFRSGDRLAVYTQNNPAFIAGLLAAWKVGGIAVPINPMNKERELAHILGDSGASALLTLDTLWADVAAGVVDTGETSIRTVVTTRAGDFQARNDARVKVDDAPDAPAQLASSAVRVTPLSTLSAPAQGLPVPERAASDPALLTYTSGTTGAPKGAINTHANVAFCSQVFRDWMDVSEQDRILGLAPLFHITGLIAQIGLSLLTGAPLILSHRFEPSVMLDSIREHRPTMSSGAITAYLALLGAPGMTRQDWSSFRVVYSGGAPIAPAVADKFEAATGHYIHNIYGLTETTSASHAVPMGSRAPVDEETGALSVGVPVFNTSVEVVDELGEPVPAGTAGELITTGPGVAAGYWRNDAATAKDIPDGHLHTGDIGVMSPAGWFFIVDRKKDMINASGYKVWPREVEDVLYTHPAVREAAVVGIPDEYRGENVKAIVSLNDGCTLTPDELRAWARERLAAYKYPRVVEILPELPKTATGKILRRALR